MHCHWCVGPYLYPGLKGSPYHPIPSAWPSPATVVEVCCEVFNTIGRGIPAYRSSFKRLGPGLRPEHLQVGSKGNTLAIYVDVIAMCTHILHKHCMWLPSQWEVPVPYYFYAIGTFFNRSEASSSVAGKLATNRLETDPAFLDMYRRVWSKLGERGYYPIPNVL